MSEVDSGAKSLADKVIHGTYLDHSSLKGYRNPEVKHAKFMEELHSHLKTKGLHLVPKGGSSIVHSPRGGAKLGKATGYHVRKIEDTQHTEEGTYLEHLKAGGKPREGGIPY